MFTKVVYLKEIVSWMFSCFFNDQCTGGSEKQQINLVWPDRATIINVYTASKNVKGFTSVQNITLLGLGRGLL